MFPGNQHYPEGRFKPQRIGGDWHVWCLTGALQVLRAEEFNAQLPEYSDDVLLINFANGSGADIQPGHPLWMALTEIVKTHEVEVFPLRLSTGYVPWTGAAKDPSRFDAIRIKTKSA